MATVVVEGIQYEVPDGSMVKIEGNTLYINGQPREQPLSGVVRVEVCGDVKQINSEASVHVHGDVNGNVTLADRFVAQTLLDTSAQEVRSTARMFTAKWLLAAASA